MLDSGGSDLLDIVDNAEKSALYYALEKQHPAHVKVRSFVLRCTVRLLTNRHQWWPLAKQMLAPLCRSLLPPLHTLALESGDEAHFAAQCAPFFSASSSWITDTIPYVAGETALVFGT